jgi:hypothetical protein
MISRVRQYFEWRRHARQMSEEVREAYHNYLLARVFRLGLPAHHLDFLLNNTERLEKVVIHSLVEKVERLLKTRGIPEHAHPSELVETVADCLNLEFVEIHNSTDLQNLLKRLEHEPMVHWYQREFKYNTGVTIRRLASESESGEQPFLAVIDCQQDSSYDGLLTKWHEIAHFLLDPPMPQYIFRRSCGRPHEPEEILAERVAERFYKPVHEALLRVNGADESPQIGPVKSPFIRPFRSPCIRPPQQSAPWWASVVLLWGLPAFLITLHYSNLWVKFLENYVPLPLLLKLLITLVPSSIVITVMGCSFSTIERFGLKRPLCEACPKWRDSRMACTDNH